MGHLLPEQIVTPRLCLREPAIEDADAIFRAYAQDEQVCHYMVWRPHRSVTETHEFIATCRDAWREGKRRPYVITERDSHIAIGVLEARVLQTTVDIGYVLERAHWGKGFMPEAVQALSSAALASPSLFRVYATCDVENLASRRALEKAGFRYEGRLERYTIHPNISLEPRACLMYARCR